MPPRAVQIVLLLAPLVLAVPIVAYLRLRRHVRSGPGPVVSYRSFRWNSVLVLIDGVLTLKGAVDAFAVGPLTQACAFGLALEFFYVAYVNTSVSLSPRGILFGMTFAPWSRFTGHTWTSDRHLELLARSRRRYRLLVPEAWASDVREVVDQNILK